MAEMAEKKTNEFGFSIGNSICIREFHVFFSKNIYVVCLLQAVQLEYIRIDIVSVPVVSVEYPIG